MSEKQLFNLYSGYLG